MHLLHVHLLHVQVAALQRLTDTSILSAVPARYRMDGTNLNPIPSWLSGVQAVALNLNRWDMSVQVGRG